MKSQRNIGEEKPFSGESERDVIPVLCEVGAVVHEDNKSQVVAKVFRFNPQVDQVPLFKEYKVPVSGVTSLQNVIRYIYEKIDSNLAFRNYNCYQGTCSCCVVKLNGKNVRACSTLITEGEVFTLEPVNKSKTVKDLFTIF